MSRMTPPSEFASLGLSGEFIGLRGGREWHGPCPFCFGTDRFRIHTDHPFPKWNYACRQCGKSGWADQLNPTLREEIDPAKLEYLREAERQRQAARAVEMKTALDKFSLGEIWQYLHQRMNEENYKWWEKQGISREWADFWQLGYIKEKPFENNGERFIRSAYTIPKFDLNWQPVNMDYRLLDPPDGVGKYRPEYGLPAAPFLSRPDEASFSDEVFVVEGSKKAAVVATHQEPGQQAKQVIGLPSCNSWAGMDDRLSACGRVWVIFDPDAQVWADKFARRIGQAARLVELPVKPDDAFVTYGMTPYNWKQILKHARKVI